MKYMVEEYDGVGGLVHMTEAPEKEVREMVEGLGGEWRPLGGSITFWECDAAKSPPTCRELTMVWVPR